MNKFRFASFVFITVGLLAIGPAAESGAVTAAAAPPPSPEVPVMRLWAGDAPGASGQRPEDIPTLTVYAPAPSARNGASVLVLPGGGYANLAPHEGAGYATWLAANGVTAYVLKYRLGSAGYRDPIMLLDAARGLRWVRHLAREGGLDPARVGIIGSSAGGHLASTLITRFDAGDAAATDPVERESSRPDVAILCYPVISMQEFAHAGSRKQLLGAEPTPESLAARSSQLHVTASTPPTFLWHTVEDKTVPVENTLLFAAALRRAGVPFAVHVYEKGPHGMGLGRPNRPAPPWADECLYWLRGRGFVP